MLNNSLYQTIMRDYDRRQAEQKHLQDLRIQEVYDKIPEYEMLEQAMVSLCAEEARSRVLNTSSSHVKSAKQLHDQITNLQNRQKTLLISNGFPENYLELQYHCPICKDTGFAGNDLCSCFRQAAAQKIYDQSRIAPILKRENFDTFNIHYYSEAIDTRFGISPADNMKTIVSRCQSYIQNFDSQFSNLFITGNTGVGKSFLTHCIANELLKASRSVLYMTAFDLIEAFEAHTFGNTEDGEESFYEDTLFDSIMNCDALIIDDLGTETINNFTVSQLFLCLNHRQEHRRSTIISTNLPVEAIQDIYSERISSRIISYYHIFLIFGEDIRIRIARSN